MEIGQRVKNRRRELGLSVEYVAKMLNKNRATVYRYESKDIEKMPVTVLGPLAKVLKTTPAYLMGWESEEEEDTTARTLRAGYKRIPLLGKIACGKPIYGTGDDDQYIEADVRADFCLRCKGDSMSDARIYDGDVVFIREQPMVDNGEIAAVAIGDEATLKRVFYYKEQEKLILQPANTKHEPLVYMGSELEDIKILGKAVAFLSNVK